MARVTNSLNSVARYIIISRLPVLSDDDTHTRPANPRQPLKILFSAARSSLIAGILIGTRHSVIAEQIAAWSAAIPLKEKRPQYSLGIIFPNSYPPAILHLSLSLS